MASYAEYLQKVEEILHEPLPDSPESSMCDWNEVGVDVALEMREKIPGTPIPGFTFFNDITLGLRPHEFTIGSGPTGCGKTTLLCNWAYLLAKAGAPILIGSIETGKNDFHRVMAGVAGGVNPYAGHSKDQIAKIFQDNPVLRSKQNVHLKYSSRVNHRRLLADILYAHDTRKIQFAFIDNLNFLLDVREHKNEIQAVDTTIHDMVTFVKKVPVHIVMIMHPNKDGIQRVEHEGMIKGSTTAVQEAANIFVWNRLASDGDAAMNIEPSWCRELMFRKVRKNGRAVGTRIVYSIHDRAPILKEEKLL